MIHHITGTIAAITAQSLVLDVQGWGLEVFIPSPQNHTLEEEIRLQTLLFWNQETGPQLFGFATATERSLFALVIGCQGIGPKLALVLLHHLSVNQCIEALLHGNIDKISTVKGLGPKKAELLIIHARNKRELLATLQRQDPPSVPAQKHNAFEDVYQALQTLNYSTTEITPILQALHQDTSSYEASFDVLMRRALLLINRSIR
jgi:Holliday junction DNA helicase RuvA